MQAKSRRSRASRFARRARLWNDEDGRRAIGFWRAANVQKLQLKPGRYNWRVVGGGALLLAAIVAAIVVRQMAPAGKAAPAATDVAVQESRPTARDGAVPTQVETPKPDTVARQPERQASAPSVAVPLPETPKPKPDLASPQPEVPKTRPETATAARQPEAQTSTPKIAVPSPEAQKPKPDAAVPQPEALKSKPETAVVAAQPEAPTTAPSPVAPLPEARAKPDVDAPQPEVPKPKPETAVIARLPEPQKSKPDADTAVRTPDAQTPRREAKDLSKDPAVPQLVLSADLARKIGQKIWLNETGGNRDAITAWNANEEFSSLGIGHFIWFPVGKWLPFEESFPQLIEFLRKSNAHLPAWLDKPQIPACPWTSRADFKKNFNSPEMMELRQFLLDTVAEQTQFLVARAQGAMTKILKATPDSADREHIITQFSRMVRASQDLYPLIDYINFKGEGTSPTETAVDKQMGSPQGWGLKQVLLRMSGTSGDPKLVLAEYADAVQLVLQQRIRNLPSNRIWEAGWLRRVDTYRRPLAEVAAIPSPSPSPRPAPNEGLRARAAR